jgi:Rrf2 family protein
MLRLSKKADYGLIAVKHLAMGGQSASCSAADIAESYGIPPQLMAKVLQKLAKRGLLVSRHGSNGGYALARAASDITALEVISAIDGPLYITSCVTTHGDCYQTARCTVREPLRRINASIMQVLGTIRISELIAEGTPRSA